ncbi:pancreatic triacylglycerol lipase-like [Agrilus planipennis]|uniref:Pancreatic triacylglycerol lipase-like n=1 Tax=Agrilus planipennis TaxID=224129 RepID=A0A1W4X962_AGRPL|nr:pancreatic triacylglycerol lipase-like [Agrilus planipennis]
MVFDVSVFLTGVLILSVQYNRVICDEIIVTPDDITLYLYTQPNRDNPQALRSSDLSDLSSSKFNSSLPNYIVFHGIVNNYRSSLYIRDPLLTVADVNLFLVDYSRPASSWDWAKEAIEGTAQITAEYINLIKRQYNVGSDKFILVGFSLGCHIAGEIGRLLDGDINTIIALDPPELSPSYIDRTKANYVQAIHTSNIAIKTAVGHLDFFANDANQQPGCNGNNECNHFRATKYYAESLISGGFTSVKCDSYELFSVGLCNGNAKAHLGGLNLEKSATGSYYLWTNSDSPFSLD